MTVTVTLEDKIARVVIDNPPVNAASASVRQELMDALSEAEANDDVRAVVLQCAGRTFVAGADISEFDKPPIPPSLPDVIDAIENASKPWVAALHGTVLGGGLELAMGCHMRVATKNCKLGLPEVTLGLIPGAGGTVRLPRLIAPENALSMIAGGKPVSAPQALQDGLVDLLADADAETAAFEAARKPIPMKRTLACPIQPCNRSAFDAARSRFLTSARGQVSISEAIAAVEHAMEHTAEFALDAERATFLQLKSSAQAKALRYIFFAERKTLKDPRVKTPGRSLQQVGIVGGGTMGSGIATSCLLRGFEVVLLEQSAEQAEKARHTITRFLEKSAQRGMIDSAAPLLRKLDLQTDFASLSGADLVIEAVFEDMAIKKDVFRQLDTVTKPQTILATNTSYLDVNEIAGALRDPSRAIGLHFFSPAHIMKLLEIVLPGDVADDVVATAAAFSKKLGKIGVLARVCDGFIGNRIMSAYRQEADFLVEEGASPEDVDEAMRAYGFAMGIFEVQDLAGLDIAWAMRKRQAATRSANQRYARIADRLCDAGRLGRKTGAGWYDYDGDCQQMSEEVMRIIAEERAAKNIDPYHFSETEIMDRILDRMRREADAVVKDGIANSAEDVDVVLVNGYGFPRWRGGPLFSRGHGPTE